MYSKIADFESLLSAYQKARKCKRYKKNIAHYGFFLENNLLKLEKQLLAECYLPSTYVCFTVSDPKVRKVAAPAFCDRILQHSLVRQIEPLFDHCFIYDSYACRKNKGTHFGLRRVKKFLQAARCKYGKETPIYCLRMDIEKYFASVSWDILLDIINKKVICPKIRRLIEKIVTRHSCVNANSCSIFPPSEIVNNKSRQGLPIGNLTSQLFANVYLNELDHFVKEKLKEKWYARYMDDFLIIHPNKDHLIKLREDIRGFLADRLKLRLHPKKVVIQNVKSGIPFVGYLIFYDHIRVRGKTLLRIRRKLKQRRLEAASKTGQNLLEATYSSVRGHLKHANAYLLQKNLFENNFHKPNTTKPMKIICEQLRLFQFLAWIFLLTSNSI